MHFLASAHLPLYRFKYIKVLQAQSLAVFEIPVLGNLFLPNILYKISKVYSFQNVFHGYRQFENLLNPA